MKLNEIVKSSAVGSPEIPKRLGKYISKKEPTSVFMDFMKRFEEERKKRK